MSTPPNPLDKFATYTYHFELHAADSWDKLKDLAEKDENKATDRFKPNGTLLINTRKDAHQTIDDVRYITMSEAVARTELLVPVGILSLTVTEPGGFSFIEKLETLKGERSVSTTEGLCFVLKILFVGRTANNDVVTIAAKLIPLLMVSTSSAVFTEQGGRYTLTFNLVSTASATGSLALGTPTSLSFVNRSVSFSAGTVTDALKMLETKLQSGYDEIYKKEGLSETGKKLVYKITYDPEIKGRIESLNKDSLAPNEPSKFSFLPTLQIATFINTILKQCPELQAKIGDSKEALQKEGNPGLFMPIIQPRVIYHDDSIELNYHIAVNRGGIQRSFIFDYYFADAGKNVDVLSYEVKFLTLGAWRPTKITTGYDWTLNQSGRMQLEKPTQWKNQIITPDVTVRENIIDVERSEVAKKKNDPLIHPSATSNDRNGHNNMPFEATPFIRLASDAIADFQSAISQQQSFEIRGNLDLLDCCAYYPDGNSQDGTIGSLYGGSNIWVKVNIWMPDSRFEGGKRQFFYTNYYKLMTVEHIFSGGQFKQHLVVQMVPEGEIR